VAKDNMGCGEEDNNGQGVSSGNRGKGISSMARLNSGEFVKKQKNSIGSGIKRGVRIYCITSSVLWDVTPCSLLKVNRSCRRKCRLHLQGRRISQARNQHKAGGKQSLFQAGFLLDLFFYPEDRGDGVISQEILSRVYGSVTNDNGFWTGLLDLLTPSFIISVNHNQL
jgi:hypothetical protein